MTHTANAAVLLCVLAHLSSCLPDDRVKLKEVHVLTLRQGQYTTGRRSHPVPQLNCLGGSAGCQDQPSVVQCYNRGTDGRTVQWECKAEMKRSQKFGLLRVTCEGYDNPQDEYVLVGSCGLEYYLERTAYGGGASHGAHGKHRLIGHHIQTTPTSTLPSFWNVIFSVLAVLGCCFLCLCCFALCDGNTDQRGRTSHNLQRTSSCVARYQPLINQPTAERSAPPPPPYAYDNPPPYSPNYVSACQQPATNSWWAPTAWPTSSSGGPGFWTGAATGGLLGYLYGNRSTDAGERHVYAGPIERTYAAPTERNCQPASYFANDSASDGCSATDVGDAFSNVVTSTGFGGTDRRGTDVGDLFSDVGTSTGFGGTDMR